MKISKTKRKYEIISISHYFPPRVGGVEVMAKNLLKGLSEKNLKCLAIYSSKKNYFKKGREFDRLSFKTPSIFNNTYPIFGITFYKKVRKILKQNPDAKVIIHSRHLTSSLLASLACRSLKHPYTVIEHNAGGTFLNSKIISNIVNWIDRNIFRAVLAYSEDILAVSNTAKEWIAKNFRIDKKKIDIIYNCYDTQYSTKELKKKENIVLFASKWIKVKDPSTTLNAFRALAPKFPNWQFIMIGEGRDLDYYKVEELPKNLTIIEKFLKQKELFELLKKSKIYINSSLSEGLALAIIEAISLGNIPVISKAKSNIEIAKIVGSEEFTFKLGDSQDLVNKIIDAMEKSDDVKYIEGIVERNSMAFSKQTMVDTYYNRLLPRHNARDGQQTLSIVMPVYNEEKLISKILKKVEDFELPSNIQKEIIIVNDASTDNSAREIERHITSHKGSRNKYVYIENKKNLGKSRSVRNGVLASTGEYVVVQDADLEYKPKDLAKFIDIYLTNPNIDVVYGNRFNEQNSFSNGIHSLGNKFLTSASNAFTKLRGFAPKDMETCYKMVRGDVMRAIFGSLESVTNFGLEPEVTAKLSRYRNPNGKRLRFAQVDIYYKPRTVSQGKKMRWFKNGVEALMEIFYFNTQPFTIEEIHNGKRVKRQF